MAPPSPTSPTPPLYALAENIPTYEDLWGRLGGLYTAYGALMVLGGLLFAYAVGRAGSLPKASVLLFAVGLGTNLVLALLPAPDIFQIFGTAARNLGLMIMGAALVFRRPLPAPPGAGPDSLP